MAFYAVRMAALNMNGLPDVNGDAFVISEIEGLWGSEVDLETTQMPDGGSRIDVWRYKELQFTLKGTAWSKNNAPFDVERIIGKLNANYFPNAAGTLLIDRVSGYRPLRIDVLRAGKPHLPAPKRNVQAFELDFIAPDPRKYDQVITPVNFNSNTQTIVNDGTTDTFVTATLNSTSSDPFLENSAQGRITLPGSVPAGTVVRFADKTMIHPSLGIRDMASRPRVWWSLAAGNNTIVTRGNWTLSFSPAYI